MNVKPRLKAPVPERAWQVAILFYLIAGLSFPKRRFLAPEQNYGRPSIGRYSYLINYKELLYWLLI